MASYVKTPGTESINYEINKQHIHHFMLIPKQFKQNGLQYSAHTCWLICGKTTVKLICFKKDKSGKPCGYFVSMHLSLSTKVTCSKIEDDFFKKRKKIMHTDSYKKKKKKRTSEGFWARYVYNACLILL